MNGPAARILPYLLAFLSSLVIMILELVASRLVARHVGASLHVWTSVIGIMLGGICLGNVLGGRLADRSQPLRVIGPLYALATALTLGCLWLNSLGGLIPEQGLPSWFRTISLVTIDFLIPGTVLGMIGPVVAKLAVEQSRRAGSAIGDVYTLGAVGSIAGTFLAGYYLMYMASTTTIITLVAASLALLATMMMGGDRLGRVVGLLTSALLVLGSIGPVVRSVPMRGVLIGGIAINPIALAGHVLALALALIGIVRLVQARLPLEAPDDADLSGMELSVRPKLTDLAMLSFLISLAFMTFEMAAGRLVSRHLGSSIYGWTSVIGVLLGGLSLGNFIGGKLADSIKQEKQASWLFLIASALLLTVLLLESQPSWFVYNPIGYLFRGEARQPIVPGGGSLLSTAITMTGKSWGVRVFIVIFASFFLPSVALGTVSPVMAKLAIERVRRTKRTGNAIGSVYAWGMVGSILGTFLTGFLLIDVLGTKGVILMVATLLALAATVLGTTWHALWAGIPLGLCVIASLPVPMFERQARSLGISEAKSDPNTDEEDGLAWVDESNYYYIKVENSQDAEGKKRTLVLDNLIHGYFILGHPERLDYDYEHVYALVADRVAKAKKKARLAKDPAAKDATAIDTMFLGGGAYTFQRYIQHTYPGSSAEVAEIDPAVTRANYMALGLPTDTPIVTTWGDARQFVERNQGKKQFDIVFGDAFNDFSVPWHLTTNEFNDKLSSMMAPDGVYMINIIDVFESDAKAEANAKKQVAAMKNPPADALPKALAAEKIKALNYGGFLGSWIETARKTFPHVYVFGTDDTPGNGLRETFVVVVSKSPLDLDTLGGRDEDPRFFQNDLLLEPRPFSKEVMDAIKIRSRGIILTDDYAPVENLLAPVAETRGDD